MRMTKAELLAAMANLPDDRVFDVKSQCGVERSPDAGTGYWINKPNGTATIVIHVNGGAQDTELGVGALVMNLAET